MRRLNNKTKEKFIGSFSDQCKAKFENGCEKIPNSVVCGNSEVAFCTDVADCQDFAFNSPDNFGPGSHILPGADGTTYMAINKNECVNPLTYP